MSGSASGGSPPELLSPALPPFPETSCGKVLPTDVFLIVSRAQDLSNFCGLRAEKAQAARLNG